MNKKIIAILGATGAQGGGLARAILADPSSGFAVRALTRDPNTAKAKELEALGAEVVAANVDDVESLTRAFTGVHGAYCVTFFWDHFSAEKEAAQIEGMAKAAKAADVKHVIWSTLEDTSLRVPLEDNRMPTLQGKYKVPHFDAKGSSDHFFTDAGVPTTFLLTSFYWDNFIHFGMGPKKGADGKAAIVIPIADKKMAGIAAEDIGRCAYGIFKAGDAYIGKRVGIAGDHPTGAEMAQTFSKVLGQEIVYTYVPPEVYRTFGFPGADDLANMFQYYRDFESEFSAARDLTVSRSLNPSLQTFAQWAEANKDRIQIG